MDVQDKDIWIFLSHSNKDYEVVRKVRNILEEHNLRPIMFFLKCLDDDCEIDDLIKREIDCRTRFILCDSPNARSSKWVKREIEYVTDIQKEYEIIDITKPIEEIAYSLANIKKDVNLYISYSRYDYELAKHIYSRLIKYDYYIFFDNVTLLPDNFAEQIKASLVNAANKGNILLVYTDNYTRSEWCYRELMITINSAEKKRIILIDLTKDGAENSLKEKVTYIRPKSNDYDDICDLILSTLLNPGNILTYCREFRDGVRRKKDSFEAKRLGNLFYEFAKERDNENSPTGVICMGICYEEGLGVKKNLLEAYSYFSDSVATDGSQFAKERAKNLSKTLFPKSEQQKKNNKNLVELINNFLKRIF